MTAALCTVLYDFAEVATEMVLIYLHVSVEGRPIIPWTVASMNEGISFLQLFETLWAGTIGIFSSMFIAYSSVN